MVTVPHESKGRASDGCNDGKIDGEDRPITLISKQQMYRSPTDQPTIRSAPLSSRCCGITSCGLALPAVTSDFTLIEH